MSQMQEDHGAVDSQGDGQPATWCRSNPMHEVRSHGGCTDRGFKCRSMTLNAQCAKSVLRWIDHTTRNVQPSVVDNL
jgi:hypothetical protein